MPNLPADYAYYSQSLDHGILELVVPRQVSAAEVEDIACLFQLVLRQLHRRAKPESSTQEVKPDA